MKTLGLTIIIIFILVIQMFGQKDCLTWNQYNSPTDSNQEVNLVGLSAKRDISFCPHTDVNYKSSSNGSFLEYCTNWTIRNDFGKFLVRNNYEVYRAGISYTWIGMAFGGTLMVLTMGLYNLGQGNEPFEKFAISLPLGMAVGAVVGNSVAAKRRMRGVY